MSRMIEHYEEIFSSNVAPLKTYLVKSAHSPPEEEKDGLHITENSIVHVFLRLDHRKKSFDILIFSFNFNFNRDEKKIRAFGECNGKFGWFPHVLVKKQRIGIKKKKKGVDTETLPQVFLNMIVNSKKKN